MPTWFMLVWTVMMAVGFFCLGQLFARQPVENRIAELMHKGYELGRKHAAESQASGGAEHG